MGRLGKIKKLGSLFRFIFSCLFVVTPVITFAVWFFFNDLPRVMRVQMMKEYMVTSLPDLYLYLDQRIYAALAGLTVSLISMAAFYVLIKLFSLYSRGIIFSSENVDCYRKLGYLIIIIMPAGILHTSVMSVIISLHNPPGQRVITLSISILDIAIVIIGVLVVMISWIMDAGRDLQDEHEFTV